jgi:hypothetical protein
MQVPVFISYHGADIVLAKELSTTLEKLSGDFSVFFDRTSISPSENFQVRIAQEIKKAEWFLIVCTGFPRRDADMLWSFYEAGQFRATLKDILVPEANKRIVCVFDSEPPDFLSEFQGVKVWGYQRTGPKIDMSTTLAKNNIQLDDSAIFNLLEKMLINAPGKPLRDVKAPAAKEMLREESQKLIRLFEAARPDDKIDEKSLQPRISFELPLDGKMTINTQVRGYEKSLRDLFSIDAETTTWESLIKACCTPNGGKPAWLSDIEMAVNTVMAGNWPANTGNKCILRNAIYRVYAARYEIYKDGRRVIYIGFLPVTTRQFDLTRRSSTLLSSLILSIRFREQLIPMAKSLKDEPTATVGELLRNFYRLLVAIEIEARQFGLVVDSDVPDESPVSAVFTDKRKKKIIEDSIRKWAKDRKTIEALFVDKPVNLDSTEEARKCVTKIVGILNKITKVNADFIELLAEELLIQFKQGRKR